MLIMTANELKEGDKVMHHNMTGGEEVTFLAGPFRNSNEAAWFITGRNSDGTVGLFNLNQISIHFPQIESGEIWVHNDGSKVHIVEVTERFVIYANYWADRNNDAMVCLKTRFNRNYKRGG